MLALEIEYLAGTVVASRADPEAHVDWPPQPDRVFSALVASWATRGENSHERTALEWLEGQDPPRILASDVSARSVPTVFVPPNDFKTSVSGNFDVIPERRRRQARNFPAGRPHNSTVRMVWESTPDAQTRERLDAVARDTAYIGHSSSLTRCRFVQADFDMSASLAPSRRIYEGRLCELEGRFQAGLRPNPGAVVVPEHRLSGPAWVASTFSDQWIVLSDDGGLAPDLRAAPVVAHTLRGALMGAYERTVGDIPEWLSGHRPDGTPSLQPHLAVLPLADVGWQRSEGRLMGCAIVLPRRIPADLIEPIVAALMERRDDDEWNIELHYGPAPAARWYLRAEQDPQKASLSPSRWIGLRGSNGTPNLPRAGRLWSTATPIALDRYPKKSGNNARATEIAESITRACRNIGLPEPSYVSFSVASALRGAPLACTNRDTPPWQRWQLPRSLAGRYLVHAIVGFDEPVRGPVILGAGRYVGLGLCLPVDTSRVKP